MKEIAFIVGIFAVCLYLLGYLQKNRKNIIILNLSSRILYTVQYILLGAFEGAALDVCGSASSVLAQNKNRGIIKKYFLLFFIGVNLVIIAIGLSLYVNLFSLFPIVGVLLHTSAFWMDDEKWIRRVSLAGCPFWLIYNFVSGAYGSCIGDILSMVSIGIAMTRYDILPKFKKQPLPKSKESENEKS
jgi:hypothetical protein